MDDLTHTIQITIMGNYPNGSKQHASISISGDGGLDHLTSAFKSAVIAAGLSEGLSELRGPSLVFKDLEALLEAACPE